MTVSEELLRRVRQLTPGIALCPVRSPTLPPATHTNCYIVGHAEFVIIDPASPYPEEQEALDNVIDELCAAGNRVREIWLTHHHADHVSGAGHLGRRLGVPIAAHALTAARLPGLVDRNIEDGELTQLGTERVRAIFTPGHAPGHLAFFEETTRFLITGDMIAGAGTVIIDPDEGDMAEYLASLAHLKALDPALLLPAHGPETTRARAKLDEYVRHRLWREKRVYSELTRRGESSADDLVGDVYSDLGTNIPPLVRALATRSLLAHLLKLVKDGRARALAGRFLAIPG